jgi:hypothetical protein
VPCWCRTNRRTKGEDDRCFLGATGLAQGHWQFPRWQIGSKTAKPLKGLDGCLGALPGDEWSRMLFFLSQNAGLPGERRPLDRLICYAPEM